jgi:hypothetical protein
MRSRHLVSLRSVHLHADSVMAVTRQTAGMRRRLATYAALATVAAAIMSGVHAPAAAAAAAQPARGGGIRPFSRSEPAPTYTITFAARQCPEYTDVMANRGRNNIQEALQDVGKDTAYSYGQGVDPAIEEANDPDCTPITGWKFQLGSGYQKIGQLSDITGATGTTVTTENSVPLLDSQGNPAGGSVAGAVTHTLTAQEIRLAQRNQLWVQGGVVGDPQLTNVFGKGAYGFAALRCSVDNNNNDNVEYASFPPQVRHVFCFAYYVNSEPGSGTIVIRKVVTGSGITQAFVFKSDLSYDPSGTFGLQVNGGNPAEQSFIRADSGAFGGPYDVKERVPDGWALTDLTCTATKPGGSSGSTWVIDKTTASVAITLADRDRVVCTYTDAPPQAPGLTVWKVTSGRAGGPFTFHVTGPVSHNLTATTATAEQPVKATLADGTSPADYTPGDYSISENMPAPTAAGRWRLEQAYCQGHVLPPIQAAGSRAAPQVHVTLENNVGQDCVFRNTFMPSGRIILRLKTIGGTATGSFTRFAAGNPVVTNSTATTTQDSVAAIASDDRDLPLQEWQVYSIAPVAFPGRGVWRFVSFSCSPGSATESGPQSLTIHLTDAEPLADCTAVYRFQPAVTVQVVKTAHGIGRSGPAVVDISCGSHGAAGRVVLPPQEYGAQLPRPIRLYDTETCYVREASSGAAPAARWTARATVNGTALKLPGSFEVAADGIQRRYVVQVINRYHLPVDCRAALSATRAVAVLPLFPGC